MRAKTLERMGYEDAAARKRILRRYRDEKLTERLAGYGTRVRTAIPIGSNS
jgi:hypothetical protein